MSPGRATAFSANAAAGDDDILGRPALAPAQRAAADLPAQRRVPFGRGVDIVVETLYPRRSRQKPVELPRGQQFRARHRAAQRHQSRVGGIFDQVEHGRGDRDAGRLARRLRNRWGFQRRTRALGDVIAGPRPRFENAAIFEQLIGLERGRQAGAPVPAQPPQRWCARAGPKRPLFDQPGNETREFLVAV